MNKSGNGKKYVFLAISAVLIIAVLVFGFYFYQVEPDFWLDRFYERIYADRLAPAPEVTLNGTPVFFDLAVEEWSIQKKNGQWYTPPKKPAGKVVISNYEPKPAAAASAHEDILAVDVDKAPDRVSLKIVENASGEAVLEEQAVLSALPLPPSNGGFTYILTLEWTGDADPYRGEFMLEIPVIADMPAKFVFSGQKLTQGQLLEITVSYAEDFADVIFVQSLYNKFCWFQGDGFLRGCLPTNYDTKPGTYQIKYGIKSEGTEFTQEIEVAKYNYEIQYLYADPQMEEETRSDAAYVEYYKYYIPVRDQSDPDRYYTEDFILPVRGRLTTEFGETRYVNDIPTSYRHPGWDIAAGEGTEVKAANRGKVAFSRFLTLTGNTVMIDHGEGLFSLYHHMRDLSVKKGDLVERGQKIGEVGSTGFSTGAHLHFMISYFQTNLEPGYFLFGQPVTYENYRELIQ